MSKKITIPAIFASLIIGLIAFLSSGNSLTILGIPSLIFCAIYSFSIHWIFFIHGYFYQTEHYFDLTGSISYLAAVTIGFTLNPSSDPRDLIIGLLIVIWAMRLGTFLFMRVKIDGKDKRFTVMKTEFVWYLMTWTIGGLWVFITMAAGLAAITSNETTALSWPAFIGICLWIFGFMIEIIADKQKRDFKKDTNKRHAFITTGLWAWSRHPNYFGEIVLWIGVTLIALPVLSGWQLATLLSPVFVYVLLTRISGIPLLENRAQKKWGSDPDYIAYLERTPELILKKPKA